MRAPLFYNPHGRDDKQSLTLSTDGDMNTHYYVSDIAELYDLAGAEHGAVDGDTATVVPLNADFVYNGQYWRRQSAGGRWADGPSAGRFQKSFIQTQFNGNVSTGGGSINTGNAKQIKASWEVRESSRVRESAPYFNEPPFCVPGRIAKINRYFLLADAFDDAYASGIDRIWLNGWYIEGEPQPGDILSVRGKKWRVIRRGDWGQAIGSAYLLERITNPAAYVDTPPLRTIWE